MNRWYLTLIAVVISLSIFMLAGQSSSSTTTIPSSIKQQDRQPVLVELFTSEGCSSCPPADQVLTQLLLKQPMPETQIICLSEHVDYWNRLGWTDPYSSAQFSTRQSEYARAFQNNNIYTPQMVVDGKTEFNGSDETRALAEIANAARIKKVALNVKRLAQEDTESVKLQIEIPDLHLADSQQSAVLMMAITEDKLYSNVKSGENAGRSLNHNAVTRRLEMIDKLNISKQHDYKTALTIPLAKQWQKQNLRIIIFLQEEAGKRVLGVSVITV